MVQSNSNSNSARALLLEVGVQMGKDMTSVIQNCEDNDIMTV